MRIVVASNSVFELGAVLSEVPASALFYGMHELRHPLGIYNLSIAEVSDNMLLVLEEHHRLAKNCAFKVPSEQSAFGALMAAQRNLIHSLREHIENCHLILTTLVNPSKVSATRRPGADNFLRAANFPGLSLMYQPLKNYLEQQLLPLVNRLKHKQGRLRGCAFFDDSEQRLGYYLEEADELGVAGPSQALHPENTAYSFARDLRLHLFFIHLTSLCLLRSLSHAISKLHNRGLPRVTSIKPIPRWDEIQSGIGTLGQRYFPQELSLPQVNIEFGQTDCTIVFPVPAHAEPFPASMRIVASTTGDGVTRSFRFPYFPRSGS